MRIYRPSNLKEEKPGAFRGRGAEFLLMLAVTAFLVLLGSCLYRRQAAQLALMDNGRFVTLGPDVSADSLKKVLVDEGYILDGRDASFIADSLSAKARRLPLPNLGSINKKDWKVLSENALALGGKGLQARVRNSYARLGLDSLLRVPALADSSLAAERSEDGSFKVGEGRLRIKAVILPQKGKHRTDGPVWVRLTKYRSKEQIDSLEVEYDDEGYPLPLQTSESWYALAQPVKGGKALSVVFSGLEGDGSYSVLPVRRGFEYGPPRGTTKTGHLSDERAWRGCSTYRFRENESRISLFSPQEYSSLKNDSVLRVRTTEGYLGSISLFLALFLIAFWGTHIFLLAFNGKASQGILPLVMLLSGICVISMYAFFSPLQDTLQGREMVLGTIIGLVALCLLSKVDYVRFWNKVSSFDDSGYLFAAAGIVLQFLLLAFGHGPEGSGVKVNLWFFQPSEITKYLTIICFAFYFAKDSKTLSKLPFKRRIIRTMILAGIFGALLLLYLATGDMGPAVVLALTFIYFYSYARGDFKQMALGVVSLGILLWISARFCQGIPMAGLAAVIIWLAIYLLYGFLSRRFHESALLMAFIICAFFFLSDIPGVPERMATRTDMCENPFDTRFFGGSQVAEGIWGLSTGGLKGRGIALGNANVIPAGHTDMILSSIGEEGGFLALLVIAAVFAMLLHRCLLTGRNSGHPFLFYLSSGIAVSMGIQFFVIALGSTGVIPLTGISVPFISFGKVGMIFSLASMGTVLGVSVFRPTREQFENTRESYDNALLLSMTTFSLMMVFLLGVFADYQVFNRDKYIVKPALTVNKEGEQVVAYNPRIRLLMKELRSGDILDRNNLVLATSDPGSIDGKDYSVFAKGREPEPPRAAMEKKKRFYPCGMHTFFWTGDANTSLMWGQEERGYFAESRHLSRLRGFKVPPVSLESRSFKDKGFISRRFGSFLPESAIPAQRVLQGWDYSDPELVALLKAGPHSEKVKEYNEKVHERDITLSLDATLQARIQNGLDAFFSTRNKSRTSTVVINGSTGEVLASALYPLPSTEDIRKVQELWSPEDNFLQRSLVSLGTVDGHIFTDSDLGMTYATAPGSTAKVMSGMAALEKTGGNPPRFTIYPYESIHNDESGDDISMEQAIVRSNNPYFIHLNNELATDDYLMKIYLAAGIRVGGKGSNQFFPLAYRDEESIKETWRKVFGERRDSYDKHLREHRNLNELYAIARKRGQEPDPARVKDIQDRIKRGLRSEFSYLAWGQGQMQATPLAMARMMGAVACNGTMKESVYLISDTLRSPSEQLWDPSNAAIMQGYLKKESYSLSQGTGTTVYGKTGTPEQLILKSFSRRNRAGAERFVERNRRYSSRTDAYISYDRGNVKYRVNLDSKGNPVNMWVREYVKKNDAWYLFYAFGKDGTPIVACIRIERTGRLSDLAKKEVARSVVIPCLKECGYLE